MSSFTLHHSNKLAFLENLPDAASFYQPNEEEPPPLPLIDEPPIKTKTDFSSSAKKFSAHLIFPLLVGAGGSGLGGGLGFLFKKAGSLASSREEVLLTLPKPGVMTVPLFFGFIFSAIGSAYGEYLAQKIVDPKSKTHWGAIVSTGLVTFVGGVTGFYSKGLTNYFLFRTGLNLTLTTGGACIDAAVEGKSITKSLYSTDFAISLGLSICLGETFHFGVKRIFRRGKSETSLETQTEPLNDNSAAAPPEGGDLAPGSKEKSGPNDLSSAVDLKRNPPTIEDPAPNKVIDDGSASDAISRFLKEHEKSPSGRVVMEAELPSVGEIPELPHPDHLPKYEGAIPVAIRERKISQLPFSTESLPEIPLPIETASPSQPTRVGLSREGGYVRDPYDYITPIPEGDPFPTPIPRELSGRDKLRITEPEPSKTRKTIDPEDPFADLSEEVGLPPPPTTRTFSGRGEQTRKNLSLPSEAPVTTDSPEAVPVVLEDRPGRFAAQDRTNKVDLNQILEAEGGFKNSSRDTPTPQQGIDEEILLQILFEKHPEFGKEVTAEDIQKLQIPKLIQRALYEEAATLELAALLFTPNISSANRARLSVFQPEEIREIIIFLKPALEVFYPERAVGLNFVLELVWKKYITLNEQLYIKAKNILETNRAIETEKEQPSFYDLIKTILQYSFHRHEIEG